VDGAIVATQEVEVEVEVCEVREDAACKTLHLV